MKKNSAASTAKGKGAPARSDAKPKKATGKSFKSLVRC